MARARWPSPSVAYSASTCHRLDENDRRGMTPLIYAHLNPYGSFQLDMHSRLPIGPPRFGPQTVGSQLLLEYDRLSG